MAAAAIISPRTADAVDNPLNPLKGCMQYFWETGRPYEKPNAPPIGRRYRGGAAIAGTYGGHQRGEEVWYGTASRLLRSGLVSGSGWRAANALIDSLPENDDDDNDDDAIYADVHGGEHDQAAAGEPGAAASATAVVASA